MIAHALHLTVRVARSNACKLVEPWATMTSGASAANSAACLPMSAALGVAQRVSIRTLRPVMFGNNALGRSRSMPTRTLR